MKRFIQQARVKSLRIGHTRDLIQGTRMNATTAATIACDGGAAAVVALHADGPPRSHPHQSPAKSPWLPGRVATPRPGCSPETVSRHDRSSDNRSAAQMSHRLAPRRAAAAHRDRCDHRTAVSRAVPMPQPLASSAAWRSADLLCPHPPVQDRWVVYLLAADNCPTPKTG